MKGLLRKDLYMMFSYCRSLLLISFTFMAASIFVDRNSFFLLFPGMYLSIIGLSLYSIDETQGWLKYSLALPYGKDLIVTERYLFNLLVSGAGLIVFVGCQLVRTLLDPGFGVFDIAELIPPYIIISLASPILNLPCMFRLGAEKGRIVYLATIAAMAGGLFPISTIVNDNVPVSGLSGIFFVIVPVFLVLYGISWQLSIRFFRAREL